MNKMKRLLLSKAANPSFKFTYLLIILLLLGTYSCRNDDCSDSQPIEPPPLRFTLVNQAGSNLVTNQNSLLHPDSIKLFVEGNAIKLQKSYDGGLGGYVFETDDFYTLLLGKQSLTFDLYLSRNDTDTLVVGFEKRYKCGTWIEFTTLFYNRERVFPSIEKGYMLTLQKK
jgi:hypothetical protein